MFIPPRKKINTDDTSFSKDSAQNAERIDTHEISQVKSEFNKEGHKPDGVYRTWHSNGQLKSEMNYKNNQLDGLHKCWDSDGKLLFEDFIRPDYREKIMNDITRQETNAIKRLNL